MTIQEAMRAEYQKMTSENLQGVLREGAGELAAWMQDIALREGVDPKYVAMGAELTRQQADQMITDIRAELTRRGQ